MNEHDCIERGLANTRLIGGSPRNGDAIRCPECGRCWQFDGGISQWPSWKEIEPPGGAV